MMGHCLYDHRKAFSSLTEQRVPLVALCSVRQHHGGHEDRLGRNLPPGPLQSLRRGIGCGHSRPVRDQDWADNNQCHKLTSSSTRQDCAVDCGALQRRLLVKASPCNHVEGHHEAAVASDGSASSSLSTDFGGKARSGEGIENLQATRPMYRPEGFFKVL